MSEKVMRCRQELSAAITRALENAHRPTNRDRRRSGPSFTESTKKVKWTCQTDEGEKTTSKKKKVTPPSAIRRSPTWSESRSEELLTDLSPMNTSQDLNDLIDNTSSLLIHRLSRSLDCDNNMDRDLIFGPGSFLSLLLDSEEPATLDLTDPGTVMMDGAGHTMEAFLSPEDEPKIYCIL